MNELMVDAARRALEDVISVGAGENFIVITDAEKKPIGEAFYQAGLQIKTKPRIYFLPEEQRPLSEIPDGLLQMLEGIDVAVTCFKGNPKETPFRIKLIKKIMTIATRLGHAPGISEQMMTQGPMQVDFAKMAQQAGQMMEAFKAATEVHVKAPAGSDFGISIEGRDFQSDTQILKGKWGNLPPGEIWCGPVEDRGEGTLVCDGSIGDLGHVPSPLTIGFKAGKITFVECPDKEFEKKCVELLNVDEMASVIGELGIGLNPGARITGNLLEDEKAFQTCHIAFGNNTDMPGGKNNSKTHRDFLIRKPTLAVTYKDGTTRVLMRDGDLAV